MSDYPFKLGANGNSLPLSGNPYWSRVTLFEIQQTPKNYCLLAFKPGLPLQASELNEIQEIQLMENTLYAAMYSSWPDTVGPEGGVAYGPGWNGTTPLYPIRDMDNTTVNMVGFTGLGVSGNIEIKKGWYLVTLRSSGLKHWVYLDQDYLVPGPSGIAYPAYLGFTASYETIKPTNDPSLYDNSNGTNIVAGSPAGADRIQVKISSPFWTSDKNTTNFSPMAKKQNAGDAVLYMNNIVVSSIGD